MTNLIGQSLGRYHILEQLGEGGMATVYKAFDTRLERNVAVKVLRTDQFAPAVISRALKRFEREAKALGQLTHPNIVPIIDYGEYEGKPYLVMPFVPGQTLKQRLKGQPIPYEEAVRILLPIARSLEYAHQQGVIHRDIKPSNVLITESGEPMLSDFGVAKIVDEEATMDLTGTSASVGTPEYMAPEQVTSKVVDARVDIYSLGIVFYEMVTGRKPYVADTPLAVLIKHASEPLPRPKLLVPTLPDKVEQIILKALAKKPEDRYQTMGEFAAALERCLAEATTHEMKVKSAQAAAKSPRVEVVPARIEKAPLQKETPPTPVRSPEGTTTGEISKPQPETVVVRTSDSAIRDNLQKPFLRRNWLWIAGGAFVILICLSMGGGSLGVAILGGLFAPPTTARTNAPTITQIVLKPTNSPIVETQTSISTSTLIPTPITKPLGLVDNRRSVISSTNANSVVVIATWTTSPLYSDPIFSPDGTILAWGSDNHAVQLWRVSDHTLLRTLEGHIDIVRCVAFSPDGTTLASGSWPGLEFWRVSDGTLLRTLTGDSTYIETVAFSPDGTTVVTSTWEGLGIWMVSDGKRLRTLGGFLRPWPLFYSAAISPDGTTIMSGGSDYTVRLWRVSDGALLRTLAGHTGGVDSVAFSPDGATLASGSWDNTVKLWRGSDGALLRTLEGHTESVMRVAFSPDGTTLASGSADHTVKLWRVSDGTILRTLEGNIMAFSPDGTILALVSGDNTISFWGVQ
jgi:serine/threonine protein kinase/sugar lactone lactonase YvrE